MEYQKYKELLRNNLDDYRYKHSLCVADEARRLAKKYGCDSERAYLAGLLHDVTKKYSEEEHLKIFSTFDIILSDIEKGSLKLWHAISGSAFVKYELNIQDEEIISAIRFHTTAKSDMTLLEKILYIADFTSADRDYDDVEIMRALSDVSLEKAMLYALKYTINELMEKGVPIHPNTFDAYNYLTKVR